MKYFALLNLHRITTGFREPRGSPNHSNEALDTTFGFGVYLQPQNAQLAACYAPRHYKGLARDACSLPVRSWRLKLVLGGRTSKHEFGVSHTEFGSMDLGRMGSTARGVRFGVFRVWNLDLFAVRLAHVLAF